MILIPAIDIRHGRVVRLRQGKDDERTSYGSSPVEAARHWVAAGASALHVVDLDAAFGESPQRNVVAAIVAEAAPVPIQVGGGVRSIEDFVELEAIGARHIVFGTAAVEKPEVVVSALERARERVVIGVDVKEGRAATHGWTRGGGAEPEALGRLWRERGASRFVYTDVSRDGEMTGVNAEATASFARAAGGGVVASGGIGSLAHLEALRGIEGVVGVIAGKALYEGAFDFGAGAAALG